MEADSFMLYTSGTVFSVWVTSSQAAEWEQECCLLEMLEKSVVMGDQYHYVPFCPTSRAHHFLPRKWDRQLLACRFSFMA